MQDPAPGMKQNLTPSEAESIPSREMEDYPVLTTDDEDREITLGSVYLPEDLTPSEFPQELSIGDATYYLEGSKEEQDEPPPFDWRFPAVNQSGDGL